MHVVNTYIYGTDIVVNMEKKKMHIYHILPYLLIEMEEGIIYERGEKKKL